MKFRLFLVFAFAGSHLIAQVAAADKLPVKTSNSEQAVAYSTDKPVAESLKNNVAVAAHTVSHLKITILSTMLAQQPGIGEWGFSALVEADSVKILFDAGARQRTVLDNAKEMGIDLSTVPYLLLSHSHDDHTGAWLSLRKEVSAVNKNALAVTLVAPGFFDTRLMQAGWNGVKENNRRRNDSLLYAESGGQVLLHSNFDEIFPGVYVTGPVPRSYPEKNYPPGMKKDASGKTVEDNLPEDMSLIIRTEQGLVLLSGCGHSGIINNVTYARSKLGDLPLFAAIGGFHLLMDSDEQIKWTAEQLKKNGIRYFMGAHCTGIEPVYQVREWAGLKRNECIVGSVGASFDPAKGFTAGPLTR
jgi:7,8-dihydropterin-6-yl-methyl-4-(beta-D-ribofuranosyl)aminobenzene 5'-phosphate synthase